MAKIAYGIISIIHVARGWRNGFVSFCFARCPFAINHAKVRFSGLVTEGGQNKPQIWNL